MPASLRGVDAVLISHLHYDHLDMPSLQRLGREMPVVAPRGAGALIKRKAGVRNVTEMGVGEEIQIGALTVRAVPAAHDTGRLPFGARAEPLGYVIEGAGRSVYFAGDTDVFPGMAELAPVDVALLPIWGWGPTMGPGHMDPGRAAEAAALLGARLAIPIHWGTYYPATSGCAVRRASSGRRRCCSRRQHGSGRRRPRCGCSGRASRPRSDQGRGCCYRRRKDSTPACTERWNASLPTRSLNPARSSSSVRSVLARANSSVTPLSSSWSSRSSSIASAVVST